jgi:hypothetical protein
VLRRVEPTTEGVDKQGTARWCVITFSCGGSKHLTSGCEWGAYLSQLIRASEKRNSQACKIRGR